jgi:elongation factor Ts
MSNISASAVKELREKTGAGMMDCKKALVESNGDMEAASDYLRKKGLAATAKKAGRTTSEGLVSTITKQNMGVLLELNSETDFVAKNDKFQDLAKTLANEFLGFAGDFDSFKNSKLSNGNSVADEIANNIAVIGENITLRRAVKLSVSKGSVFSYIHNSVSEGLGKIGVLVALESAAPAEKLSELGKQICMHIAATKPESLDVSDLDPAIVNKERQILVDQAKASGKPDAVIEKMVEGRLVKFYEQVVLTQQLFVMDGKTRISEVVENAAKEIGSPIKISGFLRYNIGEGIEKEEKDFASEVAAAVASGS